MPPLAEDGEGENGGEGEDVDDSSSEGSDMVVVEVPQGDDVNEYADDVQVVGHAGPQDQLLEGSEAEEDQDEMEETEDDIFAKECNSKFHHVAVNHLAPKGLFDSNDASATKCWAPVEDTMEI